MKLEKAKKILKDNGFEAIEPDKKKVVKNNKSDFDIDAIPMEVLDRGWKNYKEYAAKNEIKDKDKDKDK